MSKIQDKQYIKVYNYSPTKICVSTRTKNLTFEPCNDGVPSMEYLSFEDIEYLNGKSGVFRRGELRFSEDEEAAIFDALRCPDWQNTIISETDIDNMILHPTDDTVEKIVGITDVSTIDRIRGKVVFYINNGRDVSVKLADVVSRRANEIYRGKMKSEILTKKIDVNAPQSEDVAALKAELAEMKAAMAKLTEKSEPEQAASAGGTAKATASTRTRTTSAARTRTSK